jgi:hypothetical protein
VPAFSVRILGVEVFAVTLGAAEVEWTDAGTDRLTADTQINPIGYAPPDYFTDDDE